jgi:hypothetical protein
MLDVTCIRCECTIFIMPTLDGKDNHQRDVCANCVDPEE